MSSWHAIDTQQALTGRQNLTKGRAWAHLSRSAQPSGRRSSSPGTWPRRCVLNSRRRSSRLCPGLMTTRARSASLSPGTQSVLGALIYFVSAASSRCNGRARSSALSAATRSSWRLTCVSTRTQSTHLAVFTGFGWMLGVVLTIFGSEHRQESGEVHALVLSPRDGREAEGERDREGPGDIW